VLAVLIVGCSVAYLWYEKDRAANLPPPPTANGGLDAVRGVQATDHIIGNPNAEIVYVVYSDLECPFCQQFHSTMHALMDLYGKDGHVAWVFRHLPLVQLHPQAPLYALASECVTDTAGNDGFWKFADEVYATITPETKLNDNDLAALAVQAGASEGRFRTCLTNQTDIARVEQDFNEGMDAGASETPFIVILSPHQRLTLSGAQPFEDFAAMTQAMLNVLGVGETKN
jgi:protein-disulfide isomerase